MKILFQGDSITDAGRDRSDPHDMGGGYPKYASAMIADAFPEQEFEFLNLGISGDRTMEVLARVESDIVEIDPDFVSILLGINDVWHRHGGRCEPTTDEQTEACYRKILSAIREKTHAKVMIIAPFLLPNDSDKEGWRPEVERVIAIVHRLADEFADIYLPMNEVFEEGLKEVEDKTCFSGDGVHPNAEGALFLGEAYFRAVTPMLEQNEKN